MRKYQCHKTVEAAEIITVLTYPAGSGYVAFLNADGERCVQPVGTGKGNLFARGKPHVGDYLVKYDGGYMAWSPRQAFEDGYTLIRECEPVASETRHPTLQAPADHFPLPRPSVGVIVYYFWAPSARPLAAIVEFVHEDGQVNLTAFSGGPIFHGAVKHKHAPGRASFQDCWAWPWEVAP